MSSKLKPWLVLGVIFIVGILTGSALTIGLASHFLHAPVAHDMKKHWMARLTKELSLTLDEQAKIEPIVADAVTKIQSVHRDEVDRDSQIFKAADDRISALLTPEQKVRLQKMESEREKMFSGHMHSWGGSHGGPGSMHHRDGADDGKTSLSSVGGVTNPAPPAPGPQNP